MVDAYWALWRWTRGRMLRRVTRRWERRIRQATGEPDIELWHDAGSWLYGWSFWSLWTPGWYYVGGGKTPRAAWADLRDVFKNVLNGPDPLDDDEHARVERIAAGLR